MMQTKTATVASQLARYLSAATVIRSVNDGVSVGLALLALTIRPGLAGALVAALVAPHLLGPWLSRLLSWTDSRYVLGGAFTVYGAAVGAAALTMSAASEVVTILLVALAGCAGPLLAGGLTSRLPAGETSRARAFDSATWGVATAAGPGLAAVINLVISPIAAVLVMAAGALVAAGLVLTLPAEAAPPERGAGIRDCFRLAAQTRPLRNLLIAVGLTGFGLGAMPVAVPLLSVELDKPPGSGGLLISAYGLTSLIGSLTIAALPSTTRRAAVFKPFVAAARLLDRSPARFAACCLVLMGIAICVAAAAPSYDVALASFAGLGLANGALLPAILAIARLQAPADGYAQVLVLVSSTKIAGAALAGIWSSLAATSGGRTILVGTTLALLAAAGTHGGLGRKRASHHPESSLPPTARRRGRRARSSASC